MWPFSKQKKPRSRAVNVLSGKVRQLDGQIRDLKLAIQREDPPGDPINVAVKTGRRQTQPVIYYQMPGRTSNSSRTYSGFSGESMPEIGPTYDLAEFIRLQDIESYYAVSVDRHVELIMKDGFYLASQNPEAKAYVERRLREISYISGQPMADIIREFVRNTVATSNGFLVKKRDATRSSGRKIRLFAKELDPIAGLYVPDPASITVKQNKSGRPYLWISRIEENEKKWSYTDVIHVPIRKKSGFLFGTPYAVPVLEDIRSLRKLEQLQEHVSHKYAFPLMHWVVGTEEYPADLVAGPNDQQITEVNMAQQYARMLSQEGFVVTPERHDIKLVGAEGKAMDLQPFIDHMELRVFGGLRISELDIGRGDTSNRSTAKALSQILVDACKEIQDSVALYLNHGLIDEILLEGGYDPFSPDQSVVFTWPPIDKEEERAHENHHLNQYVTGGITQSELRQALGRNALAPEDEKEMFLYKWLIPLAEATAEAKAAAKPASTSKNSAAKRTKSITQPSNQTGVLATAPKVAANDLAGQIWDEAKDKIARGADSKQVLDSMVYDILRPSGMAIRSAWASAYAQRAGQLGLNRSPTSEHLDHYLRHLENRDLRSLIRRCMVMAGGGKADATKIPAALDASKPLLEVKLARFIRGAQFLGEMQAELDAGKNQVTITVDSKDQPLELTGDGWIYLAADPKLTEVKINA